MVKYAATFALIAVGIFFLSATYSQRTLSRHASMTLMKLDDEIDEAHRLTLEAGLTVMEARKASVKEISYLDAWNKGISQALIDFHGVMTSTQATVAALQAPIEQSNRTLTSANDTVRLLQAPIAQLDADLAALQPVIAHTDALVSNPALSTTISNVASTTGHMDATAADVQQEVHSLTHPTWLHKLWGGLLDVAHVFNPL